MTDAILVLNSGSSSIKFAVFPARAAGGARLLGGKIGGIGRAPDFVVRSADGTPFEEDGLEAIDGSATHGDLTIRLLDWLRDHASGITLVAAGHRVVHGGQRFSGPAAIDDDVLAQLDELGSLAPLHQPHNLAAVRAVAQWAPGLPQVACFDTSFHRTQPRLAQLYGLPREMSEEGVIRYGFHGLSYEYIAATLPQHLGPRADGRAVVAHLGNGASMCAMKQRRSVATTMGFTALDGLVMGRRCGSLDPGVVLHLQQSLGMGPVEIEHLLYRRSGLLGASGISNNMQVLEASDAAEAEEAIALFCYRAACELGALIAALEGLDALVFTAGIGENSATVRRRICARLGWLGVALDETANADNHAIISAPESKVHVLVIPTDEESVIRDATQALMPA
jgi:acetate kinase